FAVSATPPRHLERVDWSPNPNQQPDLATWPFTLPAVTQMIADGGLEIPAGVTFLIGENGSGKSTLLEAFAATYPRTGFVSPFVKVTGPEQSAEDSALAFHLRARTDKRASPAGFFLARRRCTPTSRASTPIRPRSGCGTASASRN